MPLFVVLTTLPIAGVWYQFHDEIAAKLDPSPLVIAATLAGFGILLWVADSMSRRNKNTYDWNCASTRSSSASSRSPPLIPGCGRASATMTAGLFRNYSREAAAKFGFFAAAPLLVASAAIHLRGVAFRSSEPMPDLSWLSFYVAAVVALLASLLAIGAFGETYSARQHGPVCDPGASWSPSAWAWPIGYGHTDRAA